MSLTVIYKMKYIRNIRKHILRHKGNLLSNLLWFFAGLAAIPCISGLVGWLEKWPSWLLYAVVIIESLLLLTLSISFLFLLDKLEIANKYFKDIKYPWNHLEDHTEFDETFDKVSKENEKK